MKASVNSSGQCIDYYTSDVFVSLNIISVIAYLLHNSMPDQKNGSFFWILLNLTQGDIVAAIFIAISCSYAAYEALIFAECLISTALVAIGQQNSIMCSYYQPFDYNTSRLVNNIGKLSELSWISTISTPIVKVSLTASEVCVDEFNTYEISTLTANSWFDNLSYNSSIISNCSTSCQGVKRNEKDVSMRSYDK